MRAIASGHQTTHETGTFLRGWGGAIAVLLGVAIAFALYPVISDLVLLLHSAFVALGMTTDGATLALYWLGMVSIGVGFFVAFAGSDVRMDRLRGGVGDWLTLFEEALVATGVAALWLAAAATWDSFADEFNTYEAGIELPAVGLLVLLIVSAVVIGRVRHRRSSEGQRPS